jgi:hypothetical protein
MPDFEKTMSHNWWRVWEYLDNRQKFVPEVVEAAIAEMQKRRTFQKDELMKIKQDLQQKREIDTKEEWVLEVG